MFPYSMFCLTLVKSHAVNLTVRVHSTKFNDRLYKKVPNIQIKILLTAQTEIQYL